MKRRATRCRRHLLNLSFPRLPSEYLFEPQEVNGRGCKGWWSRLPLHPRAATFRHSPRRWPPLPCTLSLYLLQTESPVTPRQSEVWVEETGIGPTPRVYWKLPGPSPRAFRGAGDQQPWRSRSGLFTCVQKPTNSKLQTGASGDIKDISWCFQVRSPEDVVFDSVRDSRGGSSNIASATKIKKPGWICVELAFLGPHIMERNRSAGNLSLCSQCDVCRLIVGGSPGGGGGGALYLGRGNSGQVVIQPNLIPWRSRK